MAGNRSPGVGIGCRRVLKHACKNAARMVRKIFHVRKRECCTEAGFGAMASTSQQYSSVVADIQRNEGLPPAKDDTAVTLTNHESECVRSRPHKDVSDISGEKSLEAPDAAILVDGRKHTLVARDEPLPVDSEVGETSNMPHIPKRNGDGIDRVKDDCETHHTQDKSIARSSKTVKPIDNVLQPQNKEERLESNKDATASSRSSAWTPLSPFRDVTEVLEVDKLGSCALDLYRKRRLDCDHYIQLKGISEPKCGSYNLVYTIEFSDGVKWCARVPGYGKKPSRSLREKMNIEYSTMKYLKTYTSIPMPDVFYWTIDATEAGAAFALIEFIDGKPLSELWWHRDVFDEAKRLNALSSIAKHMQELYRIQFDRTGMLRFGQEHSPSGSLVGPTLDYYDDGQCPWAGVIRRQQHDTNLSKRMRRSIKHLQKDEFATCATDEALKVIVKSVAKDMHKVPLSLSLDDLDLQNVFVDPVTGDVTGFIDFDGIAVRPVIFGAAAYPMWLMRDLNPAKYSPAGPYADTLEDLTRYKKHYSTCWVTFQNSAQDLEYDWRWTEHSDVMTTVWEALCLVPYREAIVCALVDRAYGNAFGLSREQRGMLWNHGWSNFEPWMLAKAIRKGLWYKDAKRASTVVATRICAHKIVGNAKRLKDYWGSLRSSNCHTRLRLKQHKGCQTLVGMHQRRRRSTK